MRGGMLLRLAPLRRSTLRLQAGFPDSGTVDSLGRRFSAVGPSRPLEVPSSIPGLGPQVPGACPLQLWPSKASLDIAKCPLGSIVVLGCKAVTWSLRSEPALKASLLLSETGELHGLCAAGGLMEVAGWGWGLDAS